MISCPMIWRDIIIDQRRARTGVAEAHFSAHSSTPTTTVAIKMSHYSTADPPRNYALPCCGRTS